MFSFEKIKPQVLKGRTYRRAIKGTWLAVHSPNDRQWHLYSETIDKFMYRTYPSEEDALKAIEFLKADIGNWVYPEDCSANQWLPNKYEI